MISVCISCFLEWKLIEFPEEYKELKSLIQSGKVALVKQYLKSLIEKSQYSISMYTFYPFGISPPSTLPISDPRKPYITTGLPELTTLGPSMQSLVMTACQHPYQAPGVIKYLCRNFSKHISLDVLEWCHHQLHSWSCVAPLHVACTGYNQNLKLVKVLVKLGASVNLKSACCEVTPLHLSVASYGGEQSLDIAQYLIEHGANVDAVDHNGDTPLTLMFRCYGGSQTQELMELLISKKANVNHTNCIGCTTLHYAAYNNDVDAVTSLLSCGASPMFELSEKPSPSLPCPLYLTTFEGVANVFTARSDCPILCKIDSLLLLGAIIPCIGTTVEDDVSRAELWRKAVTLREERSLAPPGENAISGVQEIKSISDLEKCLQQVVPYSSFDRRAEIQCLLIKERCLRYYCTLSDLLDIASTVKEYDNDLMVSMKCLKLMAHCLFNTLLPHWSIGIETYWRSSLSTLNAILNSLELKMSHKYNFGELAFRQVQEYVQHCARILEALNFSYNTALCAKTLSMHSETEAVILTLLRVLVKWLSCLSVLGLPTDDSTSLSLQQVIQELVDKNLYLMNTSLLHLIPMCFSDYECVKDVVDLYEMILQSDAAESAVNFVSSEGKRPLHCVAENASEPQHLSLISSLCDSGAHYDAVDCEGRTVVSYLIEADMLTHLEHYIPPCPLPLACLVSNTIIKENIPYLEMGTVPPLIKKYISLHDQKCSVYSFL